MSLLPATADVATAEGEAVAQPSASASPAVINPEPRAGAVSSSSTGRKARFHPSSPPRKAHHRNRSSSHSLSSSVDSSDDEGCTSDQSDDISPETGFDPFLAATRRARINSVSSSTAPSQPGDTQSSPATSEETLQSGSGIGGSSNVKTSEDAEYWSNIDGFWSKMVEDTMFRAKQGPIDLSSKGITMILPLIADLSRYVALPPPRYENDDANHKVELEQLSAMAQSKTGGMVRHEFYLAPFSSHQRYDASTLGARACSRSKSAFQPGMRSQSLARSNSAMSAFSSRSGGGSSHASSNSPGRFHDPRDKQATLNLFLAQNALTKLPSAMFQLTNLRVLSLRFNRLERLPPAIGELQNLTELNIANNQLRYLPAEILRLRLEVFNWFPNPFVKPPAEGRLTVRPLLSIKAKQSRHGQLHQLATADGTPVKGTAAVKVAEGGGASTAGAAAAQPPPLIRIGAAGAAAACAAGRQQRTMDRTRSEAQVEGFLAGGMGRLGVAPNSASIQEDDGEDSFDADSIVEAIRPFPVAGAVAPAAPAIADAAAAAPAAAAAANDEEDERSRILAAAFDEDSGSEDDGEPGGAAARASTAANAGWLKGKVEGRSRVLGQKEVALLPTLQELCVRRLLAAYDTAEGEAHGLVSPFLSPMISATGGRRRTGPRRHGASKPGTPLWGTTPKSSRTLNTRSVSFSSSTGSETSLFAKRTPTLLEAYENGTLQSLEGELGRGLVPLLEAARRSATRDWGTKARLSRTAASRKKSGGAMSRGSSAVFPAQSGGCGGGANEANDAGNADVEAEVHDTFGGIEAPSSLDRGDDACDNPWFSRCPNPKHLCESNVDPFNNLQGGGGGGRPTLALHRSHSHGSSSSVSSLGTTLGLGGGKLRSRQDDESSTRGVDIDDDSSSSIGGGRHYPVSQASSTDTLGAMGGSTDAILASASTPQSHHGGTGLWSRGPSFSRSNSSSSSSFISNANRLAHTTSFNRQPSTLFTRGFSTSSALSASGLGTSSFARTSSRFVGTEGEVGGRDWPLEEIEHLTAPIFHKAGEVRMEWISHVAGKKVGSVGDVTVDLDRQMQDEVEEGKQRMNTTSLGLIPILWRGCQRGCLDFLT